MEMLLFVISSYLGDGGCAIMLKCERSLGKPTCSRENKIEIIPWEVGCQAVEWILFPWFGSSRVLLCTV